MNFQAGETAFRPNGAHHISLGQVSPRMRMNAAPGHLNIPGVTQLDHPDRSDGPEALADLLFFPTGGGKTEAYLGLSAYTMGLRRLQRVVAVDKFAQMPWKGEVQMLFGQVNGFCARHGFKSPEVEDSTMHPKSKLGLPAVRLADHGPLRPPDLIIQDELHVISGPLGTLMGLYETAPRGV